MNRRAFGIKSICALLVASRFAAGASIIFDIDGVLTQSSKLSFLWLAGPWQLTGLYNPFSAERMFMKFLDTLEQRRADTPLVFHNTHRLPQIMCDWLCGTITGPEIIRLVETHLVGNKKYASYAGFIRAVSKVLFTPSIFVEGITPLKDGIRLFKRCAAQVDEQGNRRHRLFILSNWDPASFELLAHHKSLKQVFELCDGIVISGHVHLMKPDIRILEHLFVTYAIDPHKELTIVIDNERLNIAAARQLNKRRLHALICHDNEFKPIKKALKKLGVI